MRGDRRSATLRELAAECVALAERTIDPDTRVALLMIAQKWIVMANGGVKAWPSSNDIGQGAQVDRLMHATPCDWNSAMSHAFPPSIP